jgi:membrane-associated phospholipid phosphatase
MDQAAPPEPVHSSWASLKRRRARMFQGYLIGAVVIFFVLAVLAHSIAYFTFDVMITREVQEFRAGWFDLLMRALNWIGFTPQVNLISLAVVVLLFAIGLQWETVVILASTVGITVLGLGIKLLVDRPRPSADLVTVISPLNDYSFPSGHVLFFTAFFGFLFFLAFSLLDSSAWRTVLLILLGGLVALIGWARIYAGQHWASDVLGAYLLASVWLALSIHFYNWGKPRYFVKEPFAEINQLSE